MSPAAVFERVYLALKQRIASGELGPGEPLEPGILADRLNASVTPVRDALHRLVGEGLAEAPRGDGFRLPLLREGQVRDLYGWNQQLIELALRGDVGPATSTLPTATTEETDAAALANRTRLLFASVAGSARNIFHRGAMLAMNDRLAPLRSVEPLVLDHVAEDLAGLEALWRQRDLVRLRQTSLRYHRRRQRHAPEILRMLERG